MKIINTVVVISGLAFVPLSLIGQEPQAPPTKDGSASGQGANVEGEPQNADEAYRHASRLVQTHHLDEAISMFSKAIALKPDWAEAFAGRGRAEYQAKRYAEALEDVDHAIQLDAGHAGWYNIRGLAYSYLEQHERAIEDYNRAIELDSRVAAYFNDRGWAYRELGQFEKAIADLSHAIQLAPDYARAFENRAIAYQRMKDWAHTIADYTAAIQIAPSASLYRLRAEAKLGAGDQAGAADDRTKSAEQQAATPGTSSATPLAPGTYRVGGGVSPPTLVSKVEPQYSEQARRAGLEGTVVLFVVVTSEGTPTDLRVIRSLGQGLDEKAMEAVRKWKFRPGMKDGKAVAVQATIQVNFRLLDKPNH